jgi:hypothetical protein
LSLFLGFGDSARFLIRMLTTSLCVALITIALLAYKVFNRDVLYINPSAITGTARVGYVTAEYAGSFGEAFVSYIGNVNKESATSQYKKAYLLMSPQLQSSMHDVFLKDLNAINSSDISIQTVPLSHEVQGNTGKTFNIMVKATRTSWSGGQAGSRQIVVYSMACQKAKITEQNPFGLEVTSYDFKIMGDAANYNAAPVGN